MKGERRMTGASEEVKEWRRRHQRKLAGEWLRRRSLMEVSRSEGVPMAECEKMIAWGLLQLGEVTLGQMQRYGYWKPSAGNGMDSVFHVEHDFVKEEPTHHV